MRNKPYYVVPKLHARICRSTRIKQKKHMLVPHTRPPRKIRTPAGSKQRPPSPTRLTLTRGPHALPDPTSQQHNLQQESPEQSEPRLRRNPAACRCSRGCPLGGSGLILGRGATRQTDRTKAKQQDEPCHIALPSLPSSFRAGHRSGSATRRLGFQTRQGCP